MKIYDNDKYVDKEDSFRHSKWLSFMSKRLVVAKRLLAPDGVLFCSIGDDENCQLTFLLNEIFGEENKLGVITRVAKTAGDMGNYFAPSKDYILVYAKNQGLLSNFKDDVDETLFKKVELNGQKKGEKYRDDVAFYQASQKDWRPKQKYFVECPDGSKVIPPCSIQDEIMREGDGRWRWTKDTYLKDKHLLVFKITKKSPLVDEHGNKAKYNVYTKSYLNDRSEKGKSPRDFLEDFINRKAADLIKQYDIDFSFSKPYELIYHLIKITNKLNNIIVLDFFAGSGTTFHSTVALNAKDNGNRTCILITNNENRISEEITYPRCSRLIIPYINKNGKEMQFFKNNNLRYYKCDFVPRESSLKNKRQLTKSATDLLSIKENCYTDCTAEFISGNQSWIKLFTDDLTQFLCIVYDDEKIEEAVIILKELIDNKQPEKSVKVYVFSNGQYPYTEEFEDVLPHITLCALPDAIYKAYQNILPSKKRARLPELEDINGDSARQTAQVFVENDLFNQEG